nr:ankyrin-3-like; partial [Biomphalaria glabrata]
MEKSLNSTLHKSRALKREFDASDNDKCLKDQMNYTKENINAAIERGDHVSVANIIGTQIRRTTYYGKKIMKQAFIKACLAGDCRIVCLLLRNGADVNEASIEDFTPLKAAVLSNSYQTVELLLECEASAKTPTKPSQDNVLHVALKGGFHPSLVIGSDRWDAEFLTDTKIIKLLIDNGASVNQKCANGYLPLSLAASSNRDAVITHLIKKGADVNSVDSRYGMAPLMHAAIAGNVYIVRQLLKYNAAIDITDKWEYTALMLAAQFNKPLVVSALIQEGADVNKVSGFDGKSALILAIESYCCDTVNILLENGADVNYRKPIHKSGTTALMIAAQNGFIEAVESLLSYNADVDLRDEDGHTAEYNIMEKSICSTPLKSKAMKREFDASDNEKRYQDNLKSVKKSLFSAIESRDHVAFAKIIETQIHVTTCSGRKIIQKVFMKACLAGDINIVRFLLRKGADVNEASSDDITPLMAAVLSNSFDTVEFLLECRATVKTQIKPTQDSVLHMALKRGFRHINVLGSEKWDPKFFIDTKIIKLLIDNGALVNQKCADGYLPLSLAASSNRDAVITHLIKKGADVNGVDSKYGMTPLMHAAIAGNVYIVRQLLKYNADLDITDKWDYSALMLASQFKKYLSVLALIEEGADVNKASGFDGKSALILSTECNCCDTINILLEIGADVNYRKPIHKRGTTALMIAAKNGFKDAVETLLYYNADVDLRDEDGKTAVCLCSDDEIVEMINMSQ